MVKELKFQKTAKNHDFLYISYLSGHAQFLTVQKSGFRCLNQWGFFFGNSVYLNEHLCQFLACWQFSPCCGEISANSTRLILVEKIFSGSYKTSSRDIWSAVVR